MRIKKEPWIVGNWKMYKTHEEATAFISAFLEGYASRLSRAKVGIAPPFTAIPAVMRGVMGTTVMVGAQNMHEGKEGAFTGEISAGMLRALGVTFVLIGHSERRTHFKESDGVIAQKVKAALSAGLIPIVCVGETADERQQGLTSSVLQRQLQAGLTGLNLSDMARLTVAYEPVWAIGTGQSATPEMAEQTHLECRKVLSSLADERSANEVPLLYGGSVKPDNVQSFLAKDQIDGVLIGGASLDPKSFGEML